VNGWLFIYGSGTLKFEMCELSHLVAGFSPDMDGFGAGCMSGLKPPTYNIFEH